MVACSCTKDSKNTLRDQQSMFCKHVKGFTQITGKLTLQKIYHNPIFLIFQALTLKDANKIES